MTHQTLLKARAGDFGVYHSGYKTYEVIDHRSGETQATYENLSLAFSFARDCQSRSQHVHTFGE